MGIESSCDETACALYDDQNGLLAHTLFSQAQMHASYGGVVPELAARDHIRRFIPLLEECLHVAHRNLDDIDIIAYTSGPGLAGALLTGAAFATSLAFALGKPTVCVHHLEGHLLSPFLADPMPNWPFLALLISGGHTQLIAAHNLNQYELIGDTLDDALGEAFDKTAKMLGLGYPGGPALSALAEQGVGGQFKLPRPLIAHDNLNFSFAGLKTSIHTQIRRYEADHGSMDMQTKANLARDFVDTIVAVVTRKIKGALEKTQLKNLVVAGGVSANHQLRQAITQLAKQQNVQVFFPPLALSTDNAAMIALTACYRLQAQQDVGQVDYTISIKPPIAQQLPEENLLYLADSRFAPYGEKPTEWIIARTLQIAKWLINTPCKMIVIACNTATAHAVQAVRDDFPIAVVGIEPGLKPACHISQTHKIGVLATHNTLKSHKFNTLLASMPPNIEFILQTGYGLVDLIEGGQIESTAMQTLLRQYLDPMLIQGVDTLVLGCTHYPFIAKQIRTLYGNQFQLIDTGQAVAQQVKRLLISNNLLNVNHTIGKQQFYTTGYAQDLTNFLFQQLHIKQTALETNLDDENRPVDDALIKGRVQNAVHLREQIIDQSKTNAYRVIFGEADGLPGFIADRYGDVLVCQITSAGAEKWRESIFKALLKATNLTTLYERSDAAIRDREGLPARTGLVCGELTQTKNIDQVNIEWVDQDVLKLLRMYREQKKQFDIIILDPPKFAPSQVHLEKAARAYKEINFVAMGLLKPGGYLWTFSCSGAMTLDHFRYIVAQSARDAHIMVQVVKTLSAGSDHPSLPNFSEGEYLK
ncbi:unnamed protein product, partial [Darwinula stevensoni]